MKKFRLLIFALIVISGTMLGFAPKAHAAPNASLARSAVLMEFNSGEILFERNADERRPIASMVKIMTLVNVFDAIENGKLTLDTSVNVSQRAFGMGGSQAFLDLNGSYKASELIKTVIVASANDSCVALAEHISGSVEGFVEQMNRKAQELNMTDTLFVNCTGLPATGHYSTAKDVAKMTKELLKHSEYFTYSGIWMEDFQHSGGRITQLTNTNRLLRQYNGCDGGKTGFTNEAMHCVSATAKRGDMRLISVVMAGADSKARFNEAATMLDYGFANYENKVLLKSGENVANAKVSKGKVNDLSVVPDKDLCCLVKKGTGNVEVQWEINEKLKAPIKQGEKVGVACAVVDGKVITCVDLVAATEIPTATIWGKFMEIIRNW